MRRRDQRPLAERHDEECDDGDSQGVPSARRVDHFVIVALTRQLEDALIRRAIMATPMEFSIGTLNAAISPILLFSTSAGPPAASR